MESLQLREEELVHQTIWAAPWTVLEQPGSYEELSTHSPPGQVPRGLQLDLTFTSSPCLTMAMEEDE